MFFKPSNNKEMSRLKKKLLLYFVLIAIVSISVSAEIILEISSSRFKNNFLTSINKEISKNISKPEKVKLDSIMSKKKFKDSVFVDINSFRNRMILLLLVISMSIISSFYLFTKDIVSPMDDMVEATKKIADGDLTVTVPVMSEDEIGQIGTLINNMNTNLQDMIMQIKQEISGHREKITIATGKISDLIKTNKDDKVVETKRIKISDFKKMVSIGEEVGGLLSSMNAELSALQTFVNMYKTYKISNEIDQNEIEAVFDSYAHDKDQV